MKLREVFFDPQELWNLRKNISYQNDQLKIQIRESETEYGSGYLMYYEEEGD